MPSPLVPASPDLLTPWADLLAAELPGVDLGTKRPSTVENLSRPFVRLLNLGGPWRYYQFWYPRLLTETYAPDKLEARTLDATVARVTASLAGTGGRPDGQPGFYITASDLDSQGADSEVDGIPVVLTQALLCVQVYP